MRTVTLKLCFPDILGIGQNHLHKPETFLLLGTRLHRASAGLRCATQQLAGIDQPHLPQDAANNDYREYALDTETAADIDQQAQSTCSTAGPDTAAALIFHVRAGSSTFPFHDDRLSPCGRSIILPVCFLNQKSHVNGRSDVLFR